MDSVEIESLTGKRLSKPGEPLVNEPIATSNKPARLVRMEQEMFQLQERLTKLHAFLDTPAEQSLDVNERVRLRLQLEAMKQYSSVLGLRIAWAEVQP